MAGRARLGYLRSRANELARPETRAVAEPLGVWAGRRVRLEGRPFSFAGHEYLRAIYDDTAQHVVLSKAAQIGGTTWALLRSIHACAMGLNVGYYFPTRTDVIEFSKSRVGPLILENPFLKKLVRDTDTAGLKRIGDAHLYLRGMKSPVGMKSIPVDMLVFDELDEAPPESKTLARERLGHSDYKRILELSNPSLPDYGIDEVYQRSDQRHWTVKCPGCGAWTALDKAFPAKLGQDVSVILPRRHGQGHFRACPECEAELDMAEGEWVPDFPGKPIHGYRISQLFSPKIDPGEILEEYRLTRFPDRFYNLKIGIPWADLERRLDAASVLALCGDRVLLNKPDTRPGCVWHALGVDTGRALHAVVVRAGIDPDRPVDLIHLAVCREFAELDDLMERFSIDCCVIDGLPETHPTREFARRYPGRVAMCFFNENQRGAPRFDWDDNHVVVNRTEFLDASRAAVREKRLSLPRRVPIVEEFAQHMTCDAKVLDEDPETGIKKFRYIRTGPNHFSMAFSYALLAATSNTQWRAAKSYYDWVRRTPGAPFIC